jgi:diguanylate cyclase (GGDEF)-like protein/PAS domain S-box-containing protein
MLERWIQRRTSKLQASAPASATTSMVQTGTPDLARLTLDSLLDIVVVTALDGTVQMMNRTALDLLDYTPAEVIGAPITLFVEGDVFFHGAELSGLLRIGAVHAVETILITRTHERVSVLFDGSILRSAAGEVLAVVGAGRDKARRYTDTQQHLHELRLLHQASQALNADLDLQTVLEAVADHLIEALGVETCTITRWDTVRDEVVVLLDRDPEAATQAAVGSRFGLVDYPHYVPLLQENRSLTFRRDDPLLSSSIADWLDAWLWRSLLTIPLVRKGRVIGLIELGQHSRERHFSANEIRLAESLAAQAAAAIENARLYAESEKRAVQLHLLHDAGRALTSDLRLDAVLHKLLEIARQLTDAGYGALIVLDPDGRMIRFHATELSESQRQMIGQPPVEQGLIGALLKGDRPIRVTDLSYDQRTIGFPPDHPAMRSFLGVSLVARGSMIGCLYLTNKLDDLPFSQEDEDLVAGLAGDAATAIENARLFEQVQQFAMLDELTGLYNRRHFFKMAEREFDRARRYNSPLAAIMLDIDYFKHVNDTYGHAVGDSVLRAVAVCCQSNLRDVDLLGRYGGEEFVVLLPENDPTGVRQAAERLRQCVSELSIETGQGLLNITISLGAACLSETEPDLMALLNCADDALYAAKRAGRNRVTLY